MKYTVRFAHLASAPKLKIGDEVIRGQVIGIMGSTGKSTAPHVHLDVVEGEQRGSYALFEIEQDTPKAAPPRQALYFVDNELFGIDPVITTYYADPEYFKTYTKVHLGFDVVPIDRHASKEHFNIHWPRSKVGKVIAVSYDPNSYGHCISICYEA